MSHAPRQLELAQVDRRVVADLVEEASYSSSAPHSEHEMFVHT